MIKLPEPFGYFCDWGNDSLGLQRIAMYYGEPGNGIDDDWNRHPEVHKNTAVFTADQLKQAIRDALEEAAQVGMLVATNGIQVSAAIRKLKEDIQ